MTAQHESRLFARAREMAEDDVPGVAWEVTGILGAARAARVDPDGLGGLTGAAIALGADQIKVYTAGPPLYKPHRDETEFMEAVAGAEDGVNEAIAQARRLQDDARAALQQAEADLAAGRDEARQEAERATGGFHVEGTWGQIDYTPLTKDLDKEIADAEERIRLCRGTLQILDLLLPRLRYALTRLQAVPDDLSDTYRAAYDLVRSGSPLPKDGDWFGEPDAEMAS
jgi:hypothetical protein